MTKVSVYNQQGKEVGKMELDPKVFNVEINKALVHQAVEAQRANTRVTVAHAKGRADVRGGGRKPWRQKGTGRARHGSSRSPIWRGGGVTFGPTKERNFSRSLNKKMKKKALCMGLSDKVSENALVIIDSLDIPEGKTKKMLSILKSLPVKNSSTLIVQAEKSEGTVRSVQNIPKVSTISADSLNIIDVLAKKFIIVEKEGVKKIVETFKQ